MTSPATTSHYQQLWLGIFFCINIHLSNINEVKRILNFYNNHWNVHLNTILLPNFWMAYFYWIFPSYMMMNFCAARLAEQTGVIHFFLWCATCGIRLSSLANQNLSNRTESVQLCRPIFTRQNLKNSKTSNSWHELGHASPMRGFPRQFLQPKSQARERLEERRSVILCSGHPSSPHPGAPAGHWLGHRKPGKVSFPMARTRTQAGHTQWHEPHTILQFIEPSIGPLLSPQKYHFLRHEIL